MLKAKQPEAAVAALQKLPDLPTTVYVIVLRRLRFASCNLNQIEDVVKHGVPYLTAARPWQACYSHWYLLSCSSSSTVRHPVSRLAKA